MAKVTQQLESVVIGLEHLDQVADFLWKRLQEDEREQLVKLFIKRETTKKIEESAKRGKPIETSVEQFTMDIEKRLLNKLIYQEVRTKINSRPR